MRLHLSVRLFLLACAVALLATTPSFALQDYLTAFEGTYPAARVTRIDACLLCHVNSNPSLNSTRNNYGKAYSDHNYDFAAIESLDSDTDGYTNLAEITALTFPGDATDKPAPTTGSVTVTLLPAGAVTAGAQWRAGAGAWQNSGATVSGLAVGSVTITFKAVAGWNTPVDQSATITAGGTSSASGTYTQTMVTVPSLVGQTQAAAGSILTGANFVLGQVSQQCSDTVPAGLVISQNPLAGSSQVYGSAVSFVISTGSCPVTVPYVIGETEEAAGIIIVGANLVVGTVTKVYDSQVPTGLVITQTPISGASVAPGTAVDLTVSKGPQPVITGSVLINKAAYSTNSVNVTLGLTWSANAVRMRFSDNGSTWTAWESLKATRAYTLPAGDGYKTVRVQFIDIAGNRSTTYSDFIRLDGTVPTGSIVINNGAATVATPYVFLNLTYSDGAGSGVRSMRFSNDGSHWTLWEPVTTTRTYMLPLPSGTQTVRVQYLDAAGNYSAVYSDYIKVVPVP